MKRTFRFVRPTGTVSVTFEGETLTIPVFPGILKHPRAQDLPRLLRDATVLRKYTREALRVAAWPLLRKFPKEWLLHHLDDVPMREGRRKALLYLLG